MLINNMLTARADYVNAYLNMFYVDGCMEDTRYSEKHIELLVNALSFPNNLHPFAL